MAISIVRYITFTSGTAPGTMVEDT
jgi:hypothetical protein